MILKNHSLVLFVAASLALAGCGNDGGAGAAAPAAPAADAPVITSIAAATTTLTSTNRATTLTADVTGEDASTIRYAWSENPPSPLGFLSGANTAMATFTLTPNVVLAGVATIQLIITDTTTNQASAPMTMDINVQGCASYTLSDGTGRYGVIVNGNCIYNVSFANVASPLTTDLTLGVLPGGGAHIFAGSLMMGAAVTAASLAVADPAITKGGDGPTLTIEAGITVAFTNPGDVLVINRGARIMAEGTAAAPITFTSDEDVAGDVVSGVGGQWGGVYIAGFGFNNACDYTSPGNPDGLRTFDTDNPYQIASDSPTLSLKGTCDFVTSSEVAAVRTSTSGGARFDDNSGVLTYTIIKHAGINGSNLRNSLAALTLHSVGSGTTINNLQIFSSDDNAMEINGGAVSISNLLVYNFIQHGIRAENGYVGRLDRVLVSQADTAGQRCIDTVGSRSGDLSVSGLLTKVAIYRLTCDSSPSVGGSGVYGESGSDILYEDSLIIVTRLPADANSPNDNVCYRFRLVLSGGIFRERDPTATFNSVILSCFEGVRNLVPSGSFPFTTDLSHVAHPGNPIATVFPELTILTAAGTKDSRPLFSLPHTDSTVTATIVAGGTVIPRAMYAPRGEGVTFLGAISATDNPFAGWTFGVFTSTSTP